jgi:hypothetical protein
MLPNPATGERSSFRTSNVRKRIRFTYGHTKQNEWYRKYLPLIVSVQHVRYKRVTKAYHLLPQITKHRYIYRRSVISFSAPCAKTYEKTIANDNLKVIQNSRRKTIDASQA